LPDAAVNLFKAARLITARTVDEFVADAPRKPVPSADPNYPYLSGRATRVSWILDRDAVGLVNERIPLTMLRQVANHRALPRDVSRDIRLVALTRAFLVDDLTAVRALIPDVAREDPTIREAIAHFQRLDDATLRDELVILLLRGPGLRPFLPAWPYRDPVWGGSPTGLRSMSGMRDNWWCRMDARPPSTRYSEPQLALHPFETQLPDPAFLTASQRTLAQQEWQRLRDVDAAPNELGRRALDWAYRTPGDPRVPEVLHRVVQAVRLGCTDASSGAIAKAAFQLLHARYARSPWAARTRYWYR
jgi:hypothetical protein